MKRYISFILAAVLIFVLCFSSCNTGTSSTSSNENSDSASNTEANANTPGNTTQSSGNTENTNQSCSHSYGDWMITKAPTCLESGSKVRICSKCSYAQTAEAAALGHTTQTGVCERCNENIGQSLAESIRSVIEIYEVYVSKIDSAGGVNMEIAFTNKSDKTIKYIHFYVRPYNAVGDSQKCEIRDYSRFDAYITGPLEGGHEGYSRYGDNTSGGHHWDACWYNNSISYIDLEGVKIEYMDGTTYSLNSEEVKLAFTDYPLIDEVEELGYKTGFTYSSSEKKFEFTLMLVNKHTVSLTRNAKVDVRFVNGNNQIVFSQTYRIDEADFVESEAFALGLIKTASFSIYDWEIEAGSNGSGYLYYRVYSDDGEFNFQEESEFTSDLPKGSYSSNTWLSTKGISYDGHALTLVTNTGVFTVDDVNYSITNSRMAISVDITKIGGTNTWTNPIQMTVLDERGFTVATLKGDPFIYDAGDTTTFTVYIDNIGEGGYTLCFDDRVRDENGLYYNLDFMNGTCCAYLSDMTVENLKVPSEYAGFSVIGLCSDSYENHTLKSIEIPASVIYIDSGVFAFCDNLTSITIAQNNPVYHSAGNCIIETEPKLLIAGCSTSVIPSDGSVTCIDYNAFYELHNLKSLIIPESVTEILNYAFRNCTGLEYILLPDTLTDLASFAFEGCASLKSIVIPKNITDISAFLFYDCTSLETVIFEGPVNSISSYAFGNCISLKNLELPSTITQMGSDPFYNCDLLTENENGLLYVGNWLVGAQNNIFDAIIRNGTVGIATDIFWAQTTLKKAYIPASVRYMGYYLFESCANLRTVTIENGISYLGSGIFEDCYNLKELIFTGTRAQWDALEKDSFWFNGNLTLICADKEETFTNIQSNGANFWWTNVSSGMDNWQFNNPYIQGNTLYLPCTQVTFAAAFAWNDPSNSGKLTGEAAVTNYFNGTDAKVSGVYEKKSFAANEGQSFILEIPLDELGNSKPETIYLRLEALVNGKLSYVLLNFEIDW